MKISKLKLCWSAFIGLINPFGSMSTSVADYVLGVLKNTMAALSDTTREKIQAALNTTLNVLAVLVAVKWLIPTKWQTAYAATIAAVELLVNALSDLEIDKDELTKITDGYNDAYRKWMSPDDATCLTLKCKHGVWQAV